MHCQGRWQRYYGGGPGGGRATSSEEGQTMTASDDRGSVQVGVLVANAAENVSSCVSPFSFGSRLFRRLRVNGPEQDRATSRSST